MTNFFEIDDLPNAGEANLQAYKNKDEMEKKALSEYFYKIREEIKLRIQIGRHSYSFTDYYNELQPEQWEYIESALRNKGYEVSFKVMKKDNKIGCEIKW